MKYCRLLIHLSLLLIAAGAVATFFTADYGYIHLREGNGPAATWRDGSDGTVLPLPFHIRLDSIEAAKPEIPAWLTIIQDEDAATKYSAVNKAVSSGSYIFIMRHADCDGHGAWLHVCNDPVGRPVVYSGYALLVLSMLACIIIRGKNPYFSRIKDNRRTSPPLWLCAVIITGALSWLAWRANMTGAFPAVTLSDTFVLASIPAIGLAVLFRHSEGLIPASAFVIALASLAAAAAAGIPGNGFSPVLDNPLLGIHVCLVICAYSLFAVITLCAIAGLMKSQKEAAAMSGTQIALLRIAVTSLTAGIITGSVWAGLSWGAYWSWDPKETWSLLCLLVYLIPLHGRYIPALRRRPKTLNVFLIASFVLMLFLWFGVNRIFSGLHSYI